MTIETEQFRDTDETEPIKLSFIGRALRKLGLLNAEDVAHIHELSMEIEAEREEAVIASLGRSESKLRK